MKRHDRIAAQAMSARHAYFASTDADMRISLMLLDNLAEMLMYAAVKRQEVERTRWGFGNFGHDAVELIDLKDVEQRNRAGATDVYWDLSQNTSRTLEREFTAKIRYLAWWGLLPESFVPVIARLHDYRNEIYHRDELREQILMTSVEIYMYVVGELLRRLPPDTMWDSLGSDDPLAARLCVPRSEIRSRGFELQTLIAEKMIEGVAFEGPALAESLALNIETRLEELEENLDLIADVWKAPWQRDASKMDVIRMVQIQGPIRDAEALRNAKVPVTKRAYEELFDTASKIRRIKDPIVAFTEFAAFEEQFEPFEQKVEEYAIAADMEVQRQIDMARGK